MSIVLAILLGAAFGAALDRIAASDPDWIAQMLTFRNLHLMKAILLAIGVASIGLFGGQMLGLIDVGNMSVKATHLGVLAGGVLLGLGWGVSGYCPGTGVAAAGSGRWDAMVFVVGGLVGAAAYIVTFPWYQQSWLLAPLVGGNATLGTIPDTDMPGVLLVRGDVAGVVMGVMFVAVAFLLPERTRRHAATVAAE